MKSFNFTIKTTGVAHGYVHAETKEEAREKVLNGDYDDILDVTDYEDDFDTVKILGDGEDIEE